MDFFFFFQAEDGIRDIGVTGVQTCALPIFEVQVAPGSPLRPPSDAGVAEGGGTVTLELPNLAAWPTPLDKAEILLESAAEIEHALMVQYLYAAYSLKGGDEVSDPGQQAALDESSGDS